MSDWLARESERSLKRDGDHRNAYQRDKARIMHSASFRRLQAKTQVMGIGVSDFLRTRLTHSLEAAQIGTGICAQLTLKQPELAKFLELDEHLIEAICLAHDIGHPPFGHGGEIALHYMMHEHGGFEGNGQTFRILTHLESYSENNGMNLARRTLLGVVKYPNFIKQLLNSDIVPPKVERFAQVKSNEWHPPKGLFDSENKSLNWVLAPLSQKDKQTFMSFEQQKNKHAKTKFKSLDCSIMELADDIAYAIHDLEDAIVMDLVSQERFETEISDIIKAQGVPELSNRINGLQARLFDGRAYIRKNAIGELVNTFITSITLCENAIFDDNLLKFNAKMPEALEGALNLFKQFVFQHVIKKPELQLLEYKGQQMVMSLFDAFCNEPKRLLPSNTCQRWQEAHSEDERTSQRVIADYIAGMTDEYANRVYANLFLPKAKGMFDSL